MQLLLLIVLILLGYFLAKRKMLTFRVIFWANKWIIFIAAPAITLINVPLIQLSTHILGPIIAPVLVFGGSALMFYVVLKSILNSEEKLVLTLLGGMGNTSFLGFPIILAYYGSSYMPYAVIFDQLTFLLLVTVAQSLLISKSGNVSIKTTFIKIITFPPFMALVFAILIPKNFFGSFMHTLLDYLGKTLSPVAMLIVGYQIARFVDFKFTKTLFYGLGYKLIIAPFLVGLSLYFFNMEAPIIKTSIMEASMAPMVTMAILISDSKILPRLTAQLLTWGIVFSFPITLIWYFTLDLLIH